MAKKDKKSRISRETKKLIKIFEDIGENKLSAAKALIERLAFITVNLQDLETEIIENGWTEKYKNGANQSGIKKSAAADVYVSLTKNMSTITKQLIDLAPDNTVAENLKKAMGNSPSLAGKMYKALQK